MDFGKILTILLPETILTVGILVTLLMGLFNSSRKHVAGVTCVFFAFAAIACFKELFPANPEYILFNSFVQDSLSLFFRFLIYSVSFLITLGSAKYLSVLESPSEYYPILICASLGAGILTGVNDFLCLLVALETLGLSAILLAAYARLNQKSNEAGIKYLINTAVATAILLLGIAYIYGLTGYTNFNVIALKLYQLNFFEVVSLPVMTLISVCIVASIAFKLAAAPFHNWSPDVYTGAPTTTTLFLSVVSKTAAFGLAIRLFTSVFNTNVVLVSFAAIAVLSIVIGNYVGVIQMISRSSVKRLLAYSSIAQAGYLIIGLATFDKASISSLILYLTVYAFMNTGAFLCAIYLEQSIHSDMIYDFAGAIRKRPFMSILFSLCLINLAGLPFIPAGFIAKFFLFSAAYNSDLAYGPLLAIVGLVGSVVALYYYLYLVKIIVVDPQSTLIKQLPEKEEDPYLPVKFSAGFAVALMTGFGIFGMDYLQRVSNYIVSFMAG